MNNTTTKTLAISLILPFIGIVNSEGQDVPKRLPIEVPRIESLGGNLRNLTNLDQDGFVDLYEQLVLDFNADSKRFGADAAIALTKIFKLEDNPHAKGVFSINPMFNRDILITAIMLENNFKLVEEDFKTLKQTFRLYAEMTDNEDEHILIATIYGTLLAEWKNP